MRTLFSALALTVATLTLAPIAVIAHLLGLDRGRTNVPQWCMRSWARMICAAAGVRVVLHGAEHVARDHGTVYVSNHVSWFDVFAIASVLPRYTFIAKDELRRIPIFGWGAAAAGVVFLERENRKSAFESYRTAADEITRGQSIVVCPEGTRGRDYALRPFKKGPFVLAIAAKAPVTPCIVHGAREVMPKGGFRIHPGVVNVHLLEPIETEEYDYEHRHDLMRRVWDRMADTLRTRYGVNSMVSDRAMSGGAGDGEAMTA